VVAPATTTIRVVVAAVVVTLNRARLSQQLEPCRW